MHQLAFLFEVASSSRRLWSPLLVIVEEACEMIVATCKLRERFFNKGTFNVLSAW